MFRLNVYHFGLDLHFDQCRPPIDCKPSDFTHKTFGQACMEHDKTRRLFLTGQLHCQIYTDWLNLWHNSFR